MAGGGRDRVQARARALLVALFWQTRACPRPPPSRQVPPFMMGQERLRPRGEAYNGVRKNLLFYALPTQPGNGSNPGTIDIRQYIVDWGSTQFR